MLIFSGFYVAMSGGLKLLLFMGAGVSSWGSEGIDLKRTEKANSFYDDVMQGVFSIFFSFLFLPSL